ncbi:A/G-specific adenine glycosylase [Paracoccus aerodenitrificans]|uniref:A/G-specific adenine glycosylase n=1 Tax=Paracoccus aerodenitrificans TaxID=3017781 RepID=UPI0022EFFEB2|nr:A/G-specific adenine glycosylase [Paracoccus aerodenitrificans]WBU63679.1 A/G-specific adenine glycosylase [Paracoccus aerodenitrificans]
MREIASLLLDWYDRHARVLPWRVPPGQGGADPYRVWLSEIMLQQTTVAAVKPYYERFLTLWPRVEDLASAGDARVMAEWAGLGYYARARNLLACARTVAKNGGFPRDREGLQKLPGIGPYTSAAIASIAYDQPHTVVDGNVERVVSRLFAVETPLPDAKPRLTELAARLTPTERPGDYAQAMMDLGATICTPRKPACVICPISGPCQASAAGIAETLPRKRPKAAKPRREGVAWVVLSQNAILLEERPASGLLGGTMAFPSSGWDGSLMPPPVDATWQVLDPVTHVFTHFTLDMEVRFARSGAKPQRGVWVDLKDFSPDDLPGLMRKVWTRSLDAIRRDQDS